MAFVDVQIADEVTSWWLASLSVATAENATVPPTPVLAIAGVTAMELIVADVTVIEEVLVKPFTRAVIVAGPGATAVTTLPATAAVAGALELKVAAGVRSAVGATP